MLAEHKQVNKRTSKRTETEAPPWGRPAMKLLDYWGGGGGGLQLVCGRPTLTLSSALVPQTLCCSLCVKDS